MAKVFKPGMISPASCQAEIVGSRGGKTGQERTVVQGKIFPPTPQPGQGYLIADRTRNRSGHGK